MPQPILAPAPAALHRLEMEVAQLQKMQLLGQVTGSIAHDFRNLLTVILGSCELMCDMIAPGDPARVELETIVEAGRRATGLTSQLLAFSKRASGVATRIDVACLIEGMRGILSRMAGEDIRLATHVEPGLGHIQADPAEVEQIIANLVVNAREAMPAGGVVRIEATRVNVPDDAGASHDLAAGSYCRLRVSDSGCGMSPETLRDALGFHFTTKTQGTGLGLPTCARIARHYNGDISLRSELGVGTDVTVYLPIAEAASDAAAATPVPAGVPRGTETVLVIEDDDTVRLLLKRALEAMGYRVLLAATGAEALTIHRAHNGHVAAILCDVVLPGISGPETIARLLETPGPPPAVLFMSGHIDHPLLRDGRLRGGGHFIPKPLTRAAIGSKLREVIDAR